MTLQGVARVDSPAPPFTSGRFYLKQIAPHMLQSRGLSGIFSQLFATYFTRSDTSRADSNIQLVNKALPEDTCLEHRIDTTVQRRFAGDADLSRGRYFTLCAGSDGDDQGTLLSELYHYAPVNAAGLVGLYDNTVASLKEIFSARFGALSEPTLIVNLIPDAVVAHRLARNFGIGEDEPAALALAFPMDVREEEFDRVIDLRIPHVARWFTSEFTRLNWEVSGVRFPAFRSRAPLDRLEDLLPSLMTQETGGGDDVPQYAGLFLRRIGADALIYPSARSDAYVLVHADRVVAWRGFNLVDYRGCQETSYSATMDLGGSWPTAIPFPVEDGGPLRIQEARRIDQRGSWCCCGLAKRLHYGRIRNELEYILSLRVGPDHESNDIDTSSSIQRLGMLPTAAIESALQSLSSIEHFKSFWVESQVRRTLTEQPCVCSTFSSD